MAKKYLDYPGFSYTIAKIKALLNGKASTDLSNVDDSVFASKASQAGAGGTPIVNITSTDGVNYTGTVANVTALSVGMQFILIPDKTSTSTAPKLNLNEIGAKTLKQSTTYNTSLSTAPAQSGWLVANKPVMVMWDGTYFKTVNSRSNANDISDTVKIENGGTGADNAEDARANLGITVDGLGLDGALMQKVVEIPISSKAEGDVISLNENGVPVDYYVAQHNYGGTGRTLVVRAKATDLTVPFSSSSSSNKYEDNALDTALNSTLCYNLLDTSVQAAITEVPIQVTGSMSSTVYTINRKVFALSATEYGLSASNGATLGTTVPISDTLVTAATTDSMNRVWTRTIYYSTARNAYAVSYNASSGGYIANSTFADYEYYAQPAFTLPADFIIEKQTSIVDTEGNVVNVGGKGVYGSYSGDGATSRTLTFDGKPIFVHIYSNSHNKNYIFNANQTVSYPPGETSSNYSVNLVWDGISLKISAVKSDYANYFNQSSSTYSYFAILE